MTEPTDHMDDAALDALLADVAGTTAAPGDDLMARIMADAETAMVRPAPVATAGEAARDAGLFAGLWAALGGWAGTSGLAAAAVAGVWLGFAPPESLSGVSEFIWGQSESVSLFASEDVLGLEG